MLWHSALNMGAEDNEIIMSNVKVDTLETWEDFKRQTSTFWPTVTIVRGKNYLLQNHIDGSSRRSQMNNSERQSANNSFAEFDKGVQLFNEGITFSDVGKMPKMQRKGWSAQQRFCSS